MIDDARRIIIWDIPVNTDTTDSTDNNETVLSVTVSGTPKRQKKLSVSLSVTAKKNDLTNNRVYAKPFHVLRFTVSKSRKVSTKKKCKRKNRDFRFTAPYAIKAHLSLKLYWYYQDYGIDHRYWAFFYRALVNCNKNCNFLVIISNFSLVLLLAICIGNKIFMFSCLQVDP